MPRPMCARISSPPRKRRGTFAPRRGSRLGWGCPAASAAGSVVVALAIAMLSGCEGGPSPPAPAPGPDQPQRLPTATIRVGDVPLVVEVANSEATRQKGMMFRRRLAPDEAMLFVFEHEANLRFWMRNTYVDLDLAYIADDGTITEIGRLRAHVTDPVYSREPVRFALETPAGWFASHGIAEGDRVHIPPEVAAAP